MEQFHQVRAIRFGNVGRSQKPCGFVEHEQVFVLEENWNFPELTRGGRGKFDDAHGWILIITLIVIKRIRIAIGNGIYFAVPGAGCWKIFLLPNSFLTSPLSHSLKASPWRCWRSVAVN